MKKMLALTLAGAMVVSMPVLAATSPTAQSYSTASSSASSVSAVTASSVPHSVAKAAADENKTIGEYMNNAVTGIWAMDKVIPVAQGGGVVVDGVKTNLTFSVLKPELRRVYTIKDAAAAMGGTVLNVVKVGIPAELRFETANVNFYTPGIVDGQNVKVFQYAYSEGDDDIWNELNVTEVREDHVVVDIPNNGGVIAFVEVPAE